MLPPSQSAVKQPKMSLKILMIHGYTQSGPLFRLKTRALEKSLAKAFPHYNLQLVYPTGPHKLLPAEIPSWETPASRTNNSQVEATALAMQNAQTVPQPYGSAVSSDEREAARVKARESVTEDAWAWWTRKDTYMYEGIGESMITVAEVLKNEGPFDGVIGFSQGGAMAALVASAFEQGRRKTWGSFPACFVKEDGSGCIHRPFKFAVSYSGFKALDTTVQGAFDPPISTPLLHFIGSLDTVVEEKRSLALVDSCLSKKIVYHPGGHFVPASQREFVGALVAFTKEALAGSEGNEPKKEESVEDMDLPFGEGRL